MPDLLLSTKNPSRPVRLHTSSKHHLGLFLRQSNPFKFAHLSRDVSSTCGWHDAKLSMMNPVRNLITEAVVIKTSLPSMGYFQGET
jgi:hypothetical protein